MKMREAKLVKATVAKTPDSNNGPLDLNSSPVSCSPSAEYHPKFEDIHLYLSSDDVKLIEKIVDMYWKAYR